MEQKIIHKGNEFLGLRRIDDLATILGMKSIYLKTLALNPEYKTFKIPKKSGGLRQIEAPSMALKRVQKILNYYLQPAYSIFRPEFVHGFIIKDEKVADSIGIISNARTHISKSNILTIDLEDFFHSFKAQDVWTLFSGDPFSFPEPLANMLTMLTTWYDMLPTGSPTSPVLSNFLTFTLDKKLSDLTAAKKGVYTRYADDMTFSFDSWIPVDIIQKIKMIILGEGFRLNNKKFRIQSGNRCQMVTGLVVNEKVNVSRKYIRQVRAILFDWTINGIEKAGARYFGMDYEQNFSYQSRFLESLKGRIQFIGNVRGRDDRIYRKLIQNYNSLIIE